MRAGTAAVIAKQITVSKENTVDLQTFFSDHPSVALAFSGGVDSSFLLYAGMRYGAKIKAYYVKSAFQPEFELNDARRLADELKADLKIINLDVLASEEVTANPADRCYFCKKIIFEAIQQHAQEDGFTLLIDGSNASDDAGDRPGMRALAEMSVRSPLRECGITKPDIRQLSKEAGLFTWDKPAYACLATRIPTGRKITSELLEKVEAAENILFAMGFSDFRVRVADDIARLQLPSEQMYNVIAHREDILREFEPYFPSVVLDLVSR